jgi:hypothetical protein
MDDIAIMHYVNHHNETMERQGQQETQPLVLEQKIRSCQNEPINSKS